MKKKQIPIGIDNFKEIIEKNGYFVDKSMFIKKIIENISKVILLTRPRRFGKTLNFSMLKCFFEIPECRIYENEDNDYSYLFKGLDISKEEDIVKEHMGKYPVIDLSFKKIKANNWEDASYLFKEEISREYNRHRYLLESDIITTPGNRRKFKRIMNMEGRAIEYTSAIADLSRYLQNKYKEYKKNVIVLLDEYDTPLHYARLNGYYDQMLDIMRALMVDGMKGNKYLEKGIVTGIMKISQESIFSSFNNPKIASLTDSYCKGDFGFTKEEVRELLDYYDLNDYAKMMEEWYNGYLFGTDTVIYNPWSVLSFIDNEEHLPQPYWINTGDTSLIKRCMQLDEISSKDYIEKLLKGKTLEKKIEQDIVYEDVFNDVDKAFSYLLHAGYLKAKRKSREENKYLLSIPNREIEEIYKTILQNWFSREQKTGNLVVKLIDSLLKKDFDSFEIYLQDLLIINTSYYDGIKKIERSLKGEEKEKQENFYHGLILGLMLHLSDNYYIESNKEYGKGRTDIVILPKELNETAFILEFKNEYTTSSKTSKEAAKEAMTQIKENQYEKGVKRTGVKQIIKIGLGFKGKEAAVEWE